MILRGEARDSADTLSLRPPRPSPWPSQRAWCTTSRRTGRSAVVVLLIIAAPAPELRHGQLQRRLGELHVAVVRQIHGEADRKFPAPDPAEACLLSSEDDEEKALPPAALSSPLFFYYDWADCPPWTREQWPPLPPLLVPPAVAGATRTLSRRWQVAVDHPRCCLLMLFLVVQSS